MKSKKIKAVISILTMQLILDMMLETRLSLSEID